MKDRIPTYAGRIRLTPVENQPNVYDTERADEPIQEGTPLNSQNLLSDETAELLGFSQDSTPNDAFVALLEKINNGSKIQTGSYVGTGEATKTLMFDFTPKIIVISRNGISYDFGGPKEAGYIGVFTAGSDWQYIWAGSSTVYKTEAKFADQSIILKGNGDTLNGTAARASFNQQDITYSYVAIG